MTMYPVNDVYAAVQGEGRLAGAAMVLVRLQGCAVGCPWCDTRETWARDEACRAERLEDALGTNPRWAWCGAADLARFARGVAAGPRWALVTGGEPADHDLRPLARRLSAAGFRTALETSGTADGHLRGGPGLFDWVCVSPKFDMPGGKPVLDRVLEQANELKFVVGRPADVARAEAVVGALAEPGLGGRVVSLQPVSLSEKATKLCLETVIRRGWCLSLQAHKILGCR